MIDSSAAQESTELDTQIDDVIKHYRSLVEHGNKSVYPLVKTDLLEMRPLSFDHWTTWRKNIYQLSTPLAFLESGINGYSMASVVIWLLSFGVWMLFFSAFSQMFFGKPFLSAQSPALRWFDYITLAIYILSIILVPVAYIRTFYFLLNKNTTWKTRTIFLISTMAFLLIMLWATQTEYPGIYGKIQNVAYQRNAFLWIFFFFVVPASFFAVYIFMVGGRMAIWLINYLLESFVASYNPYRYKAIRKIVDGSITTDDETWRLIDLSVHEIRSIREWARDNLDATEKRTVPAFWLMALLGLIANTVFFENWITKASVVFSEKYSEIQIRDSVFAVPLDSLLLFMVGIPIVIGVALVIVGIFILLFRNISIQSAIIEACTVVLYAKEKPVLNDQSRRRSNWWERIFG